MRTEGGSKTQSRERLDYEDRLDEAIAEYLLAAESGQSPDAEQWLSRYPELAVDLEKFIADQAQVERVAKGLRGETDDGHHGNLSQRRLRENGEQPTHLSGGMVVGDFFIRREVGRGGMGMVYEAEQISLGRRVALKVLPFMGMMDPRRLQRFRHEAQAAAHLHHGNIVPIFFVGDERGVHYYAMQFIDGRNLADVIHGLQQAELGPRASSRDASALQSDELLASLGLSRASELASPPPRDSTQALGSPDALEDTSSRSSTSTSTLASHVSTQRERQQRYRTVAELGVHVAEALDYAHQQGIIHRDVKPANLMLDTSGHIWVTDFGLARIQADSGLTMTGDLMGTLRYMSPEQALGKRTVLDQRTDIYSLGATLYELLTLQPALTGDDRQELLRQIAFEDPIPLRRLDSSIPTELEIIVLKAMAKDAADRYPTARELADDLRRFLDHRPILAKPPSASDRARKWMRRNRTLVGGLAASLVTLCAGLMFGAVVYGLTQKKLAADLEKQNLAIAASQAKANENYALAKRAVADLTDRIAREELGRFPQLASLRSGLLTSARDFYSELIQANPQDHELYMQRASIAGALMDGPEAVADLQKATKLAPQDGNVHAVLGHFYFNPPDHRVRNLERAHEHLKRAVELNPQNAWAWDAMAQLCAASEPTAELHGGYLASLKQAYETEQDPAWKLKRLSQWRRHGEKDLPGALEALEQALTLARDDEAIVSIYYSRADILTQLGRYEEALNAASKAIEVNAYNHHLHVLRGLIHASRGDNDQAAENFRRALALAPDLPWLRKRLARWHFDRGEFDQSLAELRRAVEVNPMDEDTLVWIPLSQIAACPDEAFRQGFRELVDTLVQASGGSADGLVSRASILVQLGHAEEARKDLLAATAAGDCSSRSSLRLAVLAIRCGDHNIYQTISRQGIKRHRESQDALTLHHIAWSCALTPDALDDYQDAVALARRSVKLRPSDSQMRLALAGLLYRSRRFEEALEELVRVASEPSAGDAAGQNTRRAYQTYFEALTHHQLGHAADARKALEQASSLRHGPLANTAHSPFWVHVFTFEALDREARELIEP